MIDALLRSRGLRTGRFTSPHLVSITERIVRGRRAGRGRAVRRGVRRDRAVRRPGGRAPSRRDVVLRGAHRDGLRDLRRHPRRRRRPRGRRGRQARRTNVADGVVAVITPIALDHTRLLGDTVEEIAAEKAGIIKPGATAILAQQPLAAAEVLLRHSVEVGATVAREGVEFGVLSREQALGGQQLSLRGLRGTYENVFLPLFGVVPGGQRGLRAGRGRGVRRGRPTRPVRPASTPTWSGRRSPRSPRRAGSRSSGAARPSSSTPRTTRPGWPRPWPACRSRSPSTT